MIAYKKVTRDFRPFILTLEVPEQEAVGMMRVTEAIVVSAETLEGSPTEHVHFYSLYDWNFSYRVGGSVRAEVTKHGGGIYCMISKEDARNFMSCKASGIL